MAGVLTLTSAQRVQAASAYRHIIRSAKFTFRSDAHTYRAFVGRTKVLFRTKILDPAYLVSASVHADPQLSRSSGSSTWEEQFEAEIAGVREVSEYLIKNLVQARHSPDNKRLVLRFTEKTELGDNDSIKVKKNSPVQACPPSSCCSSDSSTSGGPEPAKLSQAALERRERRRLNRIKQSSTNS